MVADIGVLSVPFCYHNSRALLTYTLFYAAQQKNAIILEWKLGMRIGIASFNIGDRGVAKNWEKKYVALGDVRKGASGCATRCCKRGGGKSGG